MKFAAKRLAMLLVTMVVVSFLTFAAFSVISGDAAAAKLGTEITPERLAALPCGLGLGLPLCRRIAEGHGGRMVLDSRPDQGTSVTLALPDEMAADTVEDVQFDYAGGFQPALVGLADALPYQAFLQKHSDD